MPLPQATLADASLIARGEFGIDAEARLLTSERDRNFHLLATDGRAFVLKVANAAEAPDIGAFQSEALQHIADRDPSLPVPRVCRAIDGNVEAAVRLVSGTTHRARLVTYLPGQPLAHTAPSLQQAEALGRCLAAVGIALRGFNHPAAAHELLWDLKQAPKLRTMLPHIADDERRALATAVLDRYEREVRPRARSFRSQIIHNDFNPSNVLVDEGDPVRVKGVLDFGDMVESALIHDLAVAAAYQVEGADPLARPAALVRGYHAVCPLQREEVDSLFDLIALRHVLTVTIGEWRANLYPENRVYLLRHQPRAAAALASLDRIGSVEGRHIFRQACGMGSRS